MKHIKSTVSLSLLAFGFGLAVNGYSQSFLTNGLVAHYPFNGNANDATANHHDGVVFGASLCPDRFGVQSSAYYFDGNSYIDFGSGLQLGQPHTAFTITLWFNAMSPGPIFGDYEGTISGGDDVFAACIQVDDNPAQSGLPNFLSLGSRSHPERPLDYTLYVGDQVIIDRNWHAVAYIMDGVGACRVFLDGRPKATLSYDSNLNYLQAPHWLAGGHLFVGQGQYFTGYIDDIRIYNRAFSPDEVARLYGLEAAPRTDLVSPIKPSFAPGSR